MDVIRGLFHNAFSMYEEFNPFLNRRYQALGQSQSELRDKLEAELSEPQRMLFKQYTEAEAASAELEELFVYAFRRGCWLMMDILIEGQGYDVSDKAK